jgi:organic hydroperoxide reductase OsmC/OhrA
METKFIFSNTLKWNSGYQATISFGDKASFEFATPPEFRGPEGFVASANACALTTFIAKTKKAGINIISYESSAEGTLEKVEGQMMFTTIVVKPAIKTDGDKETVKEIASQVEKGALVLNSMKTDVTIDATIE